MLSTVPYSYVQLNHEILAQEVLASGPGSGFVALTSGYGMLEELIKVVTSSQLGIHDRGVVLCNVDGYYDGLLARSAKASFVTEAL